MNALQKINLRGRSRIRRRASAWMRGFSFLEVAITMLIIGVLVLTLMPTLTNRSQQAKIASAEQEVRILADAEERLGIDTNYYGRLYVLDDVDRPGDGIFNDDPENLIDSLHDETSTATGTTVHTEIETIWISLSSEDFVADPDLTDEFRDNPTGFGWQGPYVTWKRDINGNDWPDDPWGNDYIFFTIAGGLFPAPDYDTGDLDDEFVDEGPEFFADDGTSESLSALVFDRPTILSLGPDGVPGDGTREADGNSYGAGDDIFVQFGGT